MAEYQGHDSNIDAVDGLMVAEVKLKNMKMKYAKRSSNYIPGGFLSSLMNSISIFSAIIVIGIGVFHREYFILLPVILILDRLFIYYRRRLKSKKMKEYLEWKKMKSTQENEINP